MREYPRVRDGGRDCAQSESVSQSWVERKSDVGMKGRGTDVSRADTPLEARIPSCLCTACMLDGVACGEQNAREREREREGEREEGESKSPGVKQVG